MSPEDARSCERQFPFDQIIEPNVVFENGERKWLGVDVNDRLYGDFRFDMSDAGDAAIIELLYSEPVQRLGLIKQLILPTEFTALPEAADFTRLEHSIGCMLLTRRLGGTPEQQIKALLHDVAQAAFSHLWDWWRQGMGGTEDYHDQIQLEYMKSWGIDHLLASHGFELESIFDKDVQDFVERPSPDLCIDRVDYSLREFARWACPDDVPAIIDALVVKDDMIAFDAGDSAVSQILSRLFSDKYQELFWKSWASTENAAREMLLFEMIKHGLNTKIISEDDMYTVDPAVLVKLELWGDPTIQELRHLLNKQNWEFGLIKGTFESLSGLVFMAEANNKLYFKLPKFKTRWVDPSFIDADGRRVPLSWVDGDHRTKLEWHRTMADWEYSGQEWYAKFGEEILTFVELEVDPETKRILSALEAFG